MCTRAIIFGIGTATSNYTNEYQISVFESENNETIFRKMKRNSNIFT